MKKLFFNSVYLLGVIFPFRVVLSADTVNLEKKKIEVLEKMRTATILLKKSEQEYGDTTKKIDETTTHIKKKNASIQTLKTSIASIQNEILNKEKKISSLESDLKLLKLDSEKLAYQIHKAQKNANLITYLFSSDSIYTFVNKIFKIKKNLKIINKQILKIQEVSNNLIEAKKLKEEAINEQYILLKKKNREIQNLTLLKEDYITLLQSKKRGLENLKNKIEHYNVEVKKLERAIGDIIEKSITNKSEKRVVSVKELDKSSGDYPIIIPKKQEKKQIIYSKKALTKEFRSKKGKLTRPVSSGEIYGKFGVHNHPKFKRIQVDNIGIIFKIKESTKVHAVYLGKVISSLSAAGGINIVILEHGDFFSVYVGLTTVAVKLNDYVEEGEVIGSIDIIEESADLQLQIWHMKTKLDPEKWLKKL